MRDIQKKGSAGKNFLVFSPRKPPTLSLFVTRLRQLTFLKEADTALISSS